MEAFPNLESLSDEELNQMIEDLRREENEISFERRKLQGQIDILRSGVAGSGKLDVSSLAKALTGKAPPADIPEETARELAELEEQEKEISMRRRLLHGRIDLLRTELVVRLQRQTAADAVEDGA